MDFVGQSCFFGGKQDIKEERPLRRFRGSFMKFSQLLAGPCLVALLTACGGGSSTSDTANTNSPSNPASNTPASGSSAPVVTRSWSSMAVLNNNLSTQAYMPSMTSLGNGKMAIVYAQNESGGAKVYANIGDVAAGNWGAPVPLLGATGTVQTVSAVSGWNQAPSSTVVVGNQAAGSAIAAWQTNVGSSAPIWISSYVPATQTWTAAAQVGSTNAVGLKTTNSPLGAMAVAWVGSSSVHTGLSALYAYIVSNAGVVSSAVLELNVAVTSNYEIGLSNANELVVAWAGPSQQVYLAKSGTASWTLPVLLGSGSPDADALMDLAVAPDGSGAVVWKSAQTYVQTAVFDAANIVQTTSNLVQGSIDNTRPAVAYLGSGKFIAAFAASSIGSGSVLNYAPYSSVYSGGTWSAPMLIKSSGAGGAGFSSIKVDANGNAMVVIHGYNIGAFTLASGATTWAGPVQVEYNGTVPTFMLESSSGRAAFAWAYGTQIFSDVYR